MEVTPTSSGPLITPIKGMSDVDIGVMYTLLAMLPCAFILVCCAVYKKSIQCFVTYFIAFMFLLFIRFVWTFYG